MSEYQGTFSVQNLTGGTITNVVAQHSTSYWGQSLVQSQSLTNNASATGGKVITSTSQTDYWTVSFINGAGLLVVGSTSCGFESDDNGGNVNIQLFGSYFSVIMPASSSCTDNSYNTSS
jgi:hypothetical protein